MKADVAAKEEEAVAAAAAAPPVSAERTRDKGETSTCSGSKRQSIQGRGKLFELPCGVYEIPGRPHMIFKVQDYDSAERARKEVPFLFQAFEAGQEPPLHMKKQLKKQKMKDKRNSLESFQSQMKRQKSEVTLNSMHTNASSNHVTQITEGSENNGTRNGSSILPPPVVPNPNPVTPVGSGLHAPTIHEYLDWTVTANCTRPNSEEDVELDFEGFRVVTVCGRHRPAWPRPGEQMVKGGHYAVENEQFKLPWMGETLPALSVSGSAYSAATLRSGYGGKPGKYWIEVPFFATASTKRGRGFGRCLLDAIEHICQILKIDALHLCSTNDPTTISIWKKLGFSQDESTVNDNLATCGLTLKGPGLLHMDNTVQMFKQLPNYTHDKPFSRIRISHKSHIQVLYYQPLDGESDQDNQQDGKTKSETTKGSDGLKSMKSPETTGTQMTTEHTGGKSTGGVSSDVNHNKSNITYSMSSGKDTE